MKQITLDGPSERMEEKAVTANESNEPPPKIALHWSLIVANTIILMLFVGFVFGFGRYLFRVVLPEMRADIGFDYATAGILNALVSIGYLPVALWAGWLRDKLGAARLILWGCLVCFLSLIALYQVSSVWMIGVLLALMGASNAAVWTPMIEVIGRFMPKQHQVKALGLIASGTNLGILVNGLLVPFFLAGSGWRPIWLVVGLISAAITVVGLIMMMVTSVLKADHQAPKVASKSKKARHAKEAQRGKEAQRANATGGMISRLRSIDRRFFVLAGLHGFVGLFSPTFTAYLSAYMRDELAMSIALIGQTWSMIGMVGLVSGFVIGWLGDHIGIKPTMQITISLAMIATLLLLHHAFAVEFIIAGVLIAFGFLPLYGLVAGYISKNAPPEQSTFIFGLINVVHNFTAMLGSYLGGLLQTWTGTFFWTYMLILCSAGAALAITTILPHKRAHSS